MLNQIQQMKEYYGIKEETTEASFLLDKSTQIQREETEGSEDEDETVEVAFVD